MGLSGKYEFAKKERCVSISQISNSKTTKEDVGLGLT